MIIHVRGTNTRNKGAQLMLEAIHSRIGDKFELSVVPATIDRDVRTRLDLRQNLCLPGLPQLAATVGNLASANFKSKHLLTSDRDIDGVLDASGFHYTDQLPMAFSRTEAVAGRAWARRGIPKILMPQAFGPFERRLTRKWSTEALEQARLVFVRDRVSEKYVRELGVGTTIVRSPDFTIGLKPPTIDPVAAQPFFAIVPNNKMFTHGGLKRDDYVNLLSRYSAAAAEQGLATVIIVHESTDHDVAKQLADQIGAPIFIDPDPLVLKAALGQATAAIASRFHAVVGCLSQSIPTAALGWSHKYHELLHDFAVPDRVITPETDPRAVVTTLLTDDAGNRRQQDQLPELLVKVDAMWAQIFDTLIGG